MESNWKATCPQRSLQWIINQGELGWLVDTWSKISFLFVCLWRAERTEHLQRKQMLSTELVPRLTRSSGCFQSFGWDGKNRYVRNTTVGSWNNVFCHSGCSLGAGKLQHLYPALLQALCYSWLCIWTYLCQEKAGGRHHPIKEFKLHSSLEFGGIKSWLYNQIFSFLLQALDLPVSS